MADMKQLLLILGDKLVQKHGFQPSGLCRTEKNTDVLVKFVRWLDQTPEAKEELEHLGFSFVSNKLFG